MKPRSAAQGATPPEMSAPLLPAALLLAASLGVLPAGASEPVRAYADVNGLHMYYETYGAGRPLLLLHGGIADDSFWSKNIPAFAKDHRVVAPEQMGHGHTADLPARDFSYQQMAEDTAALLAKLDLENVDVVGWSDGGVIGYLLAINHPRLVRRLVTSGSNVDDDGLKPSSPGDVTPDQLPKMFRDEYEKVSPDGAKHYADFVRRVGAIWHRYPYFDRARLATIRCPTLIMVGDHDFLPVGAALHIAQEIPGAELMVVPGTGHGTFLTNPELVNLAVLRFLDAPDHR